MRSELNMRNFLLRTANCQLLRLFLFLLFLLCLILPVSAKDKPYVILISFDGFRWDYVDRGITPNLDRFKLDGVSASSLQPVYPSKTFPNHISLITGMYPENHGIILNDFVDPVSGERYRIGDSTQVRGSKWYWGEAFWETAARQGVQTASYFWPGSELPEQHRRPHLRELYDHNRPYEDRVDGVLNWLQLPEESRPQFITLYFHETDTKGHRFGPVSPEINEGIKKMDDMLGRLLDGLESIGMADKTNVIIVSDHGMTEVHTERIVNVEEILEGYNCQFGGNGPFMMVRPDDEAQLAEIYNILKTTEDRYDTYYRENIPEYFHFSQNPLIAPIFLIADLGWSLETNRSQRWLQRNPGVGGNHGYDNRALDMHGIFFATGPAFKKGYSTGTVRSIDVYPLLCEIFGIMPRNNIDGELENISFLLKGR